MVWCTVSRLGVVGPFFFEDGGETVTVTSNRYCEMLENFLRLRLEEFDDSEDFWFQLHQRPLHSPRVMVWCTVSRLGVVGPFLFEEDGETVTVTSNRYCEMLENFLRLRLEEFDDSESF